MNTPTPKIAIALLGMLAAACGSEPSIAPESADGSWTELRFHEAVAGPGSDFQDLSIDLDGRLVLTVGRGDGQSVRGLLAGEKLETLARLIDALPPVSYSPPAGCDASFFLRLTGTTGNRTYASGPCDQSAPVALLTLRSRLSSLVNEAREPRVIPVDYRVLLNGARSAIHRPERHVVRSQDELIALLSRHAAAGNFAVPRVDFRTRMVVAEFLGDQTAGANAITVAAVEQTEDGWLRIRWNESVPSTACSEGLSTTQPFVLVSVPRQSGDLLFSTERTVMPCQ